MDLLLHLIARHKMTLLEIRISLLIDQYLDFIGNVGPDELEPTSEFIEMAARLVQLKSAALLPRPEEAEQMERELVGQLVEYQMCKLAAEKLRYMSEGIFYAVREPIEIELPPEYNHLHEKTELLSAYMSLMGRASRQSVGAERFEDIVVSPVVSVTSRVMHILRSLRKGALKSVRDLFAGAGSRSESVATFLGLLELIKAKRITVAKDGAIAAGTDNGEG